MSYGMNAFIGYGKETSWGSGVAVTDFVEVLSENLSASFDRFDYKNIYGGFYEPDDMAGVQRVAGSIALAAHCVSIGPFLKGALGVNSVTVVLSGSLFRNDFTANTADWSTEAAQPSYTFEIFRDVTSSFRYAGCNVAQLQMQFAPNQDVRVTAQLIARSAAVIAKSTPTFPASPVYPFAFDTASISVGGAAVSVFDGLSITIDNQLDGIPLLNNSTQIARIRRKGPQMVRLSGTMEFDNLTEYNNFVNQTEQRITVSVTRANSFQLTIDLPRVVYTAFPLGAGGRERLTVSMDGVARYHVGSLNAVKIGLTTTNSTF